MQNHKEDWHAQFNNSHTRVIGNALIYPFKHPISFAATSIFLGALTLAISLGLIGAWFSIVWLIIIYVFCIQVIRHAASGNLEKDFLPEIIDFSFGYNLIRSIMLSAGAYLIIRGPYTLIAALIAFSFGWPPSSDQEAYNYLNLINFLALPLFIFSVLAIIWQMFYCPIALLIAGSTQNFLAIINPLIGFRLIRRMDAIFWKAFLFYVVLFTTDTCFYYVISVFAASLPSDEMGSVCRLFVYSFVSFYLYLVVSYVLGCAFHQSKDEGGA